MVNNMKISSNSSKSIIIDQRISDLSNYYDATNERDMEIIVHRKKGSTYEWLAEKISIYEYEKGQKM